MITRSGSCRVGSDSKGNSDRPGNPSNAACWPVRSRNVLIQSINDTGASVDFRVEGNTDANLIVADGSTDKVSIGVAVPVEKLHVDGVVAVNAAVAPSSALGIGKLYTKTVGVAADAIYSLENSYLDTSGNDRTAVPTNTVFSSAVIANRVAPVLDFPNAGGLTGTSFLVTPDPGLGTGACTIEFFYNTDVDTEHMVPFTDGAGTWGTLAIALVHTGATAGIEIYQFPDGSGAANYYRTLGGASVWHSSGTAMRHIALVRSAAVGANSQWSLYVNGTYLAPGSGSTGIPWGLWPTIDLGGSDYIWGKQSVASPNGGYFNGQLGQIRMTPSALYTGTGTITVPSVPFTQSGAKLFAMDDNGIETQLTP